MTPGRNLEQNRMYAFSFSRPSSNSASVGSSSTSARATNIRTSSSVSHITTNNI
jgi:hypothetical protein